MAREPQDMPNWANAVFKLGAPTVIAVFLVYQIAMAFESKLSRVEDEVRATRNALASHASNDVAQVSLIRQICYNTARTDEQRRECSK